MGFFADFPTLSYTLASEIPSYWQSTHAQGMDSHQNYEKKSKSSSYNPQHAKPFSVQVWETELFVLTPCMTAKVNGESYCLVLNQTGTQHETHIVRNITLRLGKNSSLVSIGPRLNKIQPLKNLKIYKR